MKLFSWILTVAPATGFIPQQDHTPSILEDIYYWFHDAYTPIATPSGSFSDVVPSIEELNRDVELSEPILQRLKNRTFFRIFKVDLSKECPFWAAAAMCQNPEKCAVCECEDDQIPKHFKDKPVEEFIDKRFAGDFKEWDSSIPKQIGFGPSSEILMNSIAGEESDMATYVDLIYNRPGYTSYRGGPIWNLIYEENCHFEEGCSEGGDYRRLLSGMQSNIVALAAEYYDKSNVPNERWFMGRLGPFKDRIENLYFTYALLLRTACLVSPILDDVPFETGNEKDDRAARADVLSLLSTNFNSCKEEYINNHVFHGWSNDAISQIQNVTKMLDCVECQKCRLHGKLKLTALQLAIREASSDPVSQIRKLERNEITALFNALAYFSHSIKIVHWFEERMADRRRIINSTLGVVGLFVIFYFRRKSELKHRAAEKNTNDGKAATVSQAKKQD